MLYVVTSGVIAKRLRDVALAITRT
ncbi:hypothetical protein ARTHRO9V_130259 [Arthrobacter sp. 9V]|nr:hypothetical protein ARTHRO9V_130259 [Arthrobacter sp. 9V]